MAAATAGRVWRGGIWALLPALAVSACQRSAPPPGPSELGAGVDAGRPIGQEPPGMLLRAAELAYAQADRKTALALLDLALAGIARQRGAEVLLTVGLSQGLGEPDTSGEPVADAAIAANGERVAVAHGRLVSVMDLDGSRRIHRLAEHPARLLRVMPDRSGRHVVTLAEDGVARLLSVDGEPVQQWPLMSPRDPTQPALPGEEAAHRADWLDFSPDGRLLFLTDCGSTAAVACPLRRLRVLAADSGQLMQSFGDGEQELLDYTSRRDGTLAVLFAGRPPRLFSASTGAELPFGAVASGALEKACLRGSLVAASGERPWLVSPSRRFLATLAAPSTLCLWSVDERALLAAVDLSAFLPAVPRLMSLLGDRDPYAVALSTKEQQGRRGYLLAPRTGQRLATIDDLAAVLPLDDGGALLVSRARGLRLSRLYADRRLLPIASPELAATACLSAAPLTVRGDGGLALFTPASRQPGAACSPVLAAISLQPKPTARLLPLASAAGSPLLTADFIDEQHLVVVDAAARLQVLVGTAVKDATPLAAPAVTRLQLISPPEGEQLLIETADGDRRALWLAAGKLRSTAGETLGSASTTGSAAIATAAGSVLITGGAGGTVVWRRTADNSELVRLQLVAGGAVAVSADGRFELLGDIERPADYVFCRAASYPVPYALCAERLRTPGLLAATLRK